MVCYHLVMNKPNPYSGSTFFNIINKAKARRQLDVFFELKIINTK